MATEFVRLADVPAVEEIKDSDTVLVVQDGDVKKAPKSAVSGNIIKTVIITDNWYDAIINGAEEPPTENPIYSCSNMTYEEARAILASGEILNVFFKGVSSDGPTITHTIIHYLPEIKFIPIFVLLMSEPITLFWSADGFSIEPPDTQ